MSGLFYGPSDWGTQIALGDDEYLVQPFSGGFSFTFYAANYSEVYVGSNGYLTFGSGDTTYTSTVCEFKNGSQARIAPYWADLDPRYPGPSGGVFTNQLANAFVVTWAYIPYYGSGNPPINTFQVVLYDDGRIGMGYETLDNDFSGMYYTPVVGIAKGSSGPSKIFRYDGVLNQDLNETVHGPVGVLDNSQIVFTPIGQDYTISTPIIVTPNMVLPIAIESPLSTEDETKEMAFSVETENFGITILLVLDIVYSLCGEWYQHNMSLSRYVVADGSIKNFKVLLPIGSRIYNVESYYYLAD